MSIRLRFDLLFVKLLRDFTRWLEALPDAAVRGVVLARIKRISLGLMGDVSPVGDGGSKRSQTADIKRARALAKLLDE